LIEVIFDIEEAHSQIVN